MWGIVKSMSRNRRLIPSAETLCLHGSMSLSAAASANKSLLEIRCIYRLGWWAYLHCHLFICSWRILATMASTRRLKMSLWYIIKSNNKLIAPSSGADSISRRRLNWSNWPSAYIAQHDRNVYIIISDTAEARMRQYNILYHFFIKF